MMNLRDLLTGPPGGWKFLHTDTDFVSTAVTFHSLVPKVRQYRENHNIPVVSEGYEWLSDEIEAAICASLEPGDRAIYCVADAPRKNGCKGCGG